MTTKDMRHPTSTPDELPAVAWKGRSDVDARPASPGRPAATSRGDPAVTVGDSLRAVQRVVLAISGGRDSMALMHAATRTAPECVAVVATFDHGTGVAARDAATLVTEHAERYGLRCQRGRASSDTRASEAAWRTERWRFLRAVAAATGARAIVTAHTRDDHVETVFIRILRHAGARGLAALDVDGDVLRPWLRTDRWAVARYASHWELQYVEDPSNTSRAFLRNRVRLDLLPALCAVRPGFDGELLGLATEAASWRRDVERIVGRAHPLCVGADGVSVAAHDLRDYDVASLAVVWPVLAARAGVTLDRRGTARLGEFTRRAKIGAVMQVSGGFEVQRSRFSLVVRRPGYVPADGRTADEAEPGPVLMARAIRWIPVGAPH
jgi:tRNA(Ile)-lysidine synthase